MTMTAPSSWFRRAVRRWKQEHRSAWLRQRSAWPRWSALRQAIGTWRERALKPTIQIHATLLDRLRTSPQRARVDHDRTLLLADAKAKSASPVPSPTLAREIEEAQRRAEGQLDQTGHRIRHESGASSVELIAVQLNSERAERVLVWRSGDEPSSYPATSE